jgi:hypothetical protein
MQTLPLNHPLNPPTPWQHFDLVDERELSPLAELIDQFTTGRGGSGGDDDGGGAPALL